MPNLPMVSHQSMYTLSPNTNVFTVGAAFDISYNGFSKRIVNQRSFSRTNTLSSNTQNLDQSSYCVRLSQSGIDAITGFYPIRCTVWRV
ncbi:MAG: hypothetical protein IPL65_13690 [Lewinellaceae bacterium]|nr:hypothetical protein [Lewinellaceae bacterium]